MNCFPSADFEHGFLFLEFDFFVTFGFVIGQNPSVPFRLPEATPTRCMLEELYETTPPSTGVYLLVVHGHRVRQGGEHRAKLYRARSRLCRNEILQENRRLKALAEIYTMHSFAQLCNLNFLSKICHHFWQD